MTAFACQAFPTRYGPRLGGFFISYGVPMSIQKLKRERTQLNTRVQELAVQAQTTLLSDAETAEFADLEARFTALSAQIDTLDRAERIAMASAVPVDSVETGKQAQVEAAALASGLAAPTDYGQTYARPKDHAAQASHNMGVFSGIVAALKHSPGNLVAGAEFAKKTMRANGVGDGVAMALSSVNASGGAVLIPSVLAQTVIERLIPNAVVRGMGPLSLPLNNGNLTIPRLAGGAIAGYIGRDNDAPVSQQSFDDVQLVAKKLACLVPIGNDLIRFAGIDTRVDTLIVEDTAFSMANAEDVAFIRGDGTNSTPKGLRTWCLPQNVLKATPTAGLAASDLVQAIMHDAGRCVLALRRANIRLRKPGWLMHPDSVQFLADLLTTTGNKVFPEIADGMFRGFPIGMTTEIPTNLTSSGATGNGSEIYFVDFAEMVIGESMNMSVAISMDAAYTDPATGNTVSAFQRDLTLIRIITENDFGPRHAEAIAIIDGITWYR
jgi:HK97 family phage major capsid protein